MDREFEVGDKVIMGVTSGDYYGEIIECLDNDIYGDHRYKVTLYGYSPFNKNSITEHIIKKMYLKIDKQYYREERLKQLLDG